ncbi:MAG: hypothetical protein WCY19_06840 [Candidatus Gastranaerophilaceae bacterium]
MIQRVGTISFGEKSSLIKDVKQGVEEVRVTRDDLYDATLGTGAAATVANGNKIIRGVKGVFVKSKDVAKNTKTFNSMWLNFLKSAEKIKGLGHIARFIQKPLVMKVSGVCGGFMAISAGIVDMTNLLNVSAKMVDTGKFPKVDLAA